MSHQAWCDINCNCDTLNFHDMCGRNGYKCQKEITFTPRQYMLKSSGFEIKLQDFFGYKKAWDSFLKPVLNIASPYIGMANAAKTKNSENGKATCNILESILGIKIFFID